MVLYEYYLITISLRLLLFNLDIYIKLYNIPGIILINAEMYFTLYFLHPVMRTKNNQKIMFSLINVLITKKIKVYFRRFSIASKQNMTFYNKFKQQLSYFVTDDCGSY